jgi:predicted amidohydrolase YtcJ
VIPFSLGGDLLPPFFCFSCFSDRPIIRSRGAFAYNRLAMKSATLFFIISSALLMQGQNRKSPDVIFVNGDVYPGHTVDAVPNNGTLAPVKSKTNVRAQAIAVTDGKILAVGSNEEIRKLKGGKTQVVDLGGHFVMPGFNDAHVHLASGGFEKLNVDLVGSTSLKDMQERIAARAKTSAPGEWILGEGWDHTKWTEVQTPTRQDLDAVTGNHPAIFTRVDAHIAVANTAALKAAGVNAQTKDPQGGKIDHDASGEATGILREGAQELVRDKIPRPTPSQHRKAMELALADAAQWGITSAQSFDDWEDFLALQEIEHDGKLTLRVSEWLPFKAPLAILEQHRAAQPRTDAILHTGMLKGFMDGSLGSRTAALLAPYSDDAKNSGLPQYDQQQLNAMARERVAAHFQFGFHAIGDRGAQMALDAIAEAQRYARENHIDPPSPDGFRDRIEHCQVIAPDQFARFHELGVIASMQPNHLLTDMNWAMVRIGPERARTSYAWRKFLQNGVHIAFGTDYPVEPITPFRGLYAAITRKNEQGSKEYFPEERLTVDEAIAAYTTGAAYAEFEEKTKGTLAPGMLADFVVLDRDITKASPHDILATKVQRTVVGGKTVYEAK